MRSHARGAVRSAAQWVGQQSTERMLGAAGRAAAAWATGKVSARPPSTTARSSVWRRAAVKTGGGIPQPLRLAGGPRVAPSGPVGPEVPHIALGVLEGEVPRAVVGVVRLVEDLGPRGLGALVQRVRVVDRDVDPAPAGARPVPVRIRRLGAEHDHARAQRELGMGHVAIALAVDDHPDLEPERLDEPVDRRARVAVAERGIEDLRALAHSGERSAAASAATLHRAPPPNRALARRRRPKPAAIRPATRTGVVIRPARVTRGSGAWARPKYTYSA